MVKHKHIYFDGRGPTTTVIYYRCRRGPGFIEPAEPAIATPLSETPQFISQNACVGCDVMLCVLHKKTQPGLLSRQPSV